MICGDINEGAQVVVYNEGFEGKGTEPHFLRHLPLLLLDGVPDVLEELRERLIIWLVGQVREIDLVALAKIILQRWIYLRVFIRKAEPERRIWSLTLELARDHPERTDR